MDKLIKSGFCIEDRVAVLKTYPILEYGQPKSSLKFVEAYTPQEAVEMGQAGEGREATVAELLETFGEDHEK